MSVEGEIIYLQSKSRELFWRVFQSVYNDGVKIVQDNENVDIMDIPDFSIPVLREFERILRSISNNKMMDFIDSHMDTLLKMHPELQPFPQEIAWGYIRSKYAAKNNIVTFNEKDHIVPFNIWYYNTFQCITLKLLDNPSLYDEYLVVSEKVLNIEKTKEIIDKAIIEGIYLSIHWPRVFECKTGTFTFTPPPSATLERRSTTTMGGIDNTDRRDAEIKKLMNHFNEKYQKKCAQEKALADKLNETRQLVEYYKKKEADGLRQSEIKKHESIIDIDFLSRSTKPISLEESKMPSAEDLNKEYKEVKEEHFEKST